MKGILKVIEAETDGKCYKSYKFCNDAQSDLPSLSYDFEEERMSVSEFAELDKSEQIRDMSNMIDIVKNQEPLFKFFIDGSRRTYKVDDIEYSRKVFPVIAGQIGVACCRRDSKDIFKKEKDATLLVLSLPDKANADGAHSAKSFFSKIISDINKLPIIGKFKMEFSDILTYSSSKLNENEKYENRGIAKIQDKMIECEKNIVSHLVSNKCLDAYTYALKDGSLQYKKMQGGNPTENKKFKNNYRSVVGASKLFNPELCKDKKGKNNASLIADLKLHHRTPAFKYENQELYASYAIWYVRIREAKHTGTPFAGILKLEKMLISEAEIEEGLDSAEIDRITANIILERNPVCYGQDARWANHLYPIHLTERYLKSSFISDVHFLNLF